LVSASLSRLLVLLATPTTSVVLTPTVFSATPTNVLLLLAKLSLDKKRLVMPARTQLNATPKAAPTVFALDLLLAKFATMTKSATLDSGATKTAPALLNSLWVLPA